MTDTALAQVDRTKSKPFKVTGRLKKALDLMVWGDGERRYLPDNEAAVRAGMNVLSIRWALQQPHVLAYYKQQREVLRTRECATNIHRLTEIRDAANNMPAIQAIRMLEQLDDNASISGAIPRTPGMTVVVVNQIAGASQTTTTIDAQAIPISAISDD